MPPERRRNVARMVALHKARELAVQRRRLRQNILLLSLLSYSLFASSILNAEEPDTHLPFQFDLMTQFSEKDSISYFRFGRHDIHSLISALDMPDMFQTGHGGTILAEEALCLMLHRFSYPNRWCMIREKFGNRSEGSLSTLFYVVVAWFLGRWGFLVSAPLLRNRQWELPKLQRYADCIHRSTGMLSNCVGLHLKNLPLDICSFFPQLLLTGRFGRCADQGQHVVWNRECATVATRKSIAWSSQQLSRATTSACESM